MSLILLFNQGNGSSVYSETPSDTLVMADALANTMDMVNPLADTVVSAETLASLISSFLSASDTVVSAETLTHIADLVNSQSDNILSADTWTVGVGVGFAPSDTIVGVDSLVHVLSLPNILADTGISTVTQASVVAFGNTVSSTVVGSDALTEALVLAGNFSDSATTVDALVHFQDQVNALTDTIAAIESLQHTASWISAYQDSSTATSSLTSVISYQNSVGDTGITVQSVAEFLARSVSVGDTATTSTSVNHTVDFVNTPEDILQLGDGLSAGFVYWVQNIAETGPTLDFVVDAVNTVEYNEAPQTTASILELSNGGLLYVHQHQDSITTQDAIAAGVSYSIGIDDLLTMVDGNKAPTAILLQLRLISVGNFIYGFPGEISSDPNSDTVWVAEMSGNGVIGRWRSAGAHPGGVVGCGVGAVGNYLYAVGGSYQGQSVATVKVARINSDGSLGAWRDTMPLLESVGHPAVESNNGILYVVEGPTLERNSQPLRIYFAQPLANGEIARWHNGGVCLGIRGGLGSVPLPSS